MFSTDLFEEFENEISGQVIFFKENNTVYPPNPQAFCIDVESDGNTLESPCGTVEDYFVVPGYSQEGLEVTIENGLIGNLSESLDTLVLEETFRIFTLNYNDSTSTTVEEIALGVYVRE